MAEGEDEADRLYGLPLEEFTDARNARARELKRDGDAETAETVRKLPKPTRAAWAANQLARHHPKDMEKLLRAGEQLRAAHEGLLSGEGGEAVAKASGAEREAVGRLVERARRLEVSGAALERVSETLHAAAASEEVREQLRRGVLATEHRAAMFGGLSAGTAAAPKVKKSKKTKPGTTPRADEKKRRQDEERAERERRQQLKAARAELKRLQAEHGKAQRALDTAERRLGRAREELEAHESGAAAAREREAKARDAAAGAESELGRLEG